MSYISSTIYPAPSQGELLNQLSKEQRYEHHLRAVAAAHYGINPVAAAGTLDQHKFAPLLNGSTSLVPVNFARELSTNPALRHSSSSGGGLPPLHSSSAAYAPYGGGSGSPRLPQPPLPHPKMVATPPKQQVVSPPGRTTVSSIARYSR